MEKLFSKVNYSYMSDPLNEKLKETNKKFLEALNSLPVSTRKNITKSFKTINKINDKKKKEKERQLKKKLEHNEKLALKSISKLFDENRLLKNQLKEIKKDKKQIIQKIKEEKEKRKDIEHKRLHKNVLKELKEQKQQLKESILAHPITKRHKEFLEIKRKAYQHENENIQFKAVREESAYKGASTTYYIRKVVNNKPVDIDFEINENKTLDLYVVITKMIPVRKELYVEKLKTLKHIRVEKN